MPSILIRLLGLLLPLALLAVLLPVLLAPAAVFVAGRRVVLVLLLPLLHLLSVLQNREVRTVFRPFYP